MSVKYLVHSVYPLLHPTVEGKYDPKYLLRYDYIMNPEASYISLCKYRYYGESFYENYESIMMLLNSKDSKNNTNEICIDIQSCTQEHIKNIQGKYPGVKITPVKVKDGKLVSSKIFSRKHYQRKLKKLNICQQQNENNTKKISEFLINEFKKIQEKYPEFKQISFSYELEENDSMLFSSIHLNLDSQNTICYFNLSECLDGDDDLLFNSFNNPQYLGWNENRHIYENPNFEKFTDELTNKVRSFQDIIVPLLENFREVWNEIAELSSFIESIPKI